MSAQIVAPVLPCFVIRKDGARHRAAARPSTTTPKQHAKFIRLCASNMNRRLQKAKAAKTIPRIAALDLLGSRFTTRRACSRDVSHALRRAPITHPIA
jgi:hypothetical protein